MATATAELQPSRRRLPAPRLPVPIWMLLISLILGLLHGLNAKTLIATINSGFGASLGDYARILLPSFVIAYVVSRAPISGLANWLAPAVAPFAGAAMVCPDTAYAALGPMTQKHKLSVLYGAYAGFKLLVPAGPLIVATGLGALDTRLFTATLPVFVAAWLTGLLCARLWESEDERVPVSRKRIIPGALLMPLMTLACLLAAGTWLADRGLPPALGLLLSPKGALLGAAALGLAKLSSDNRAEAMTSAVERTAPLLLTIGAASALGTMITATLPIGRWALLLAASGLVLPSLFVFTALFKLAKGSSMATFAGTTGIIAAVLPALHVTPAAAVLAMCCGAFITIAPNDSLYWIVREDYGRDWPKVGRKVPIGAALQGLAGFAAVEALAASGIL